jgi:phage gp36-like protein
VADGGELPGVADGAALLGVADGGELPGVADGAALLGVADGGELPAVGDGGELPGFSCLLCHSDIGRFTAYSKSIGTKSTFNC